MINWIVNIIGPENSFEVFSFILTYVFYLVGTLLFLYKRRHKNKFFLRIIPAIILGFPFAFGLALLNKTAIGTSFTIITRMLCYHSLSAYIFALLLFCYDEPIADCVCFGAVVYVLNTSLIRHILSSKTSLVSMTRKRYLYFIKIKKNCRLGNSCSTLQ